MGFISRLVTRAQEYSMDDFFRDTRHRSLGGQYAGVEVSEGAALGLITVYSCVRVLAETIGTLPMDVYRKRNGGGKDEARDHPVHALLHDTPNEEMVSSTWRETTVSEQALAGNSYSIITHNQRGYPIELYPIPWYMVNPQRNPETKKIEYAINDRGKAEIYPAEMIFHTRGFGSNGLVGYSPIRMAASTVGVGLATQQFTERFYTQGMNVGGLLEHPNSLSDEAYKRLTAWLDEKGSGIANSWKPLILEEGMKYSRIPIPLADAQFIETKKFNRDELCGLFRVPPHMIANLEKSSFNNIEQMSTEFVMYSLMPYITRLEQTANWRLFTPTERAQGYYVRCNVKGLLRGDYISRQQGLQIQRQNGVINADTWRELEDMNPTGEESGKKYLVNGNMIPADLAASKTAENVLKGGEGTT
ncbi:phage portal protein [Paenibacillus jamilae]|nr:phage portal protein [Paenibacillus jamilae]